VHYGARKKVEPDENGTIDAVFSTHIPKPITPGKSVTIVVNSATIHAKYFPTLVLQLFACTSANDNLV
jgi:hypothetical protein